jgi:hypothetical protein
VANDPNPQPARPRIALRAFFAVLVAVVLVVLGVTGYLEWYLRMDRSGEPGELGAVARSQETLVGQRLESLGLTAASLADDPDVPVALDEAAASSRESPPAEGEAGPAPGASQPDDGEGTLSTFGLEPLLQDLLDNRGLDLAVIAGAGGATVAVAGSDRAAAEALLGSPAAVRALEDGRARGAWSRDGRLYLTAAARVEREFEALGLAVVAVAVDRALALEAHGLSRADAAFLVPSPGGGGAEPVASTLGRETGEALVPALRDAGLLTPAFRDGESPTAELALSGRTYQVRVTPLQGARGGAQGLAVTLVERAGAEALVRTLQTVAGGAGLAALLLGGLLALAASRGALGPLKEVEGAAEHAGAGDLAGAARFALPPKLASVFADLAEKRSLEAAVAASGRGSGEGAAPDSARRERGAVVVVEMPRYARLTPEDEPRDVIERLGRDLVRLRRAVTGRGGRLEASLGHRVLAIFPGDRPEARALGAGAEILRALSEPENAFDEPVPPACAIAAGEVVLGGSEGGRAVAGLPVQQAESLLREAGSGDLILSRNVFRTLDEELRAGGVELAAQRGLLTPQPVYLLDADRASRAAAAVGQAEGGSAGGELAALAPGVVLGDRFELTARLASGQSSVVFLARDRQADALVAVKALRRGLLIDLSPLEALDSDLRTVLRVVHPGIARVVELGMSDGVPFLAGEYVEGRSLARVLASQRFLPPAGALRCARQVAGGLAAVHDAGLAHGDLRPETVILEPRGNARVIDLGVALLFPPPGTDPEADRALGSPRYLAPERLQGGEPSPAADVWAVGALLAELFTGRPVYGPPPERDGRFGGSERIDQAGWDETRERVLAGPREVPDPTELPEGLAAVLERCLAREPGERYAAGSELLAALAAVRADIVVS